MTWRSRLFALFPATWLALLLGCVLWLLLRHSLWALLALLLVTYLLPPLCFRLHEALWPLREGRSYLDAPGYAPWWGSHQFQVMYNAFPALESALRLLPGCYSAWLRLWGSRIGRGVHWTPRVDIADRSLLDVGDGVVFGHLSACYAHLVKPHRGRLLLYLRRIHIGSGAFISAGSRLGPGVRIAAGTVLPLLSDVGVGRRLGDGP